MAAGFASHWKLYSAARNCFGEVTSLSGGSPSQWLVDQLYKVLSPLCNFRVTLKGLSRSKTPYGLTESILCNHISGQLLTQTYPVSLISMWVYLRAHPNKLCAGSLSLGTQSKKTSSNIYIFSQCIVHKIEITLKIRLSILIFNLMLYLEHFYFVDSFLSMLSGNCITFQYTDIP